MLPALDSPDRPSWTWRDVGPELAIAVALLVAAGTCGYAVAGARAAVLVVVVFAALALVVMHRLVPNPKATERPEPGLQRPPGGSPLHVRLRGELIDGRRSLAAYRAVLRPKLTHLLAARLAENHAVNLYRQPEEAKAILCANPRDSDLWPWVEPSALLGKGRPDTTGIPSRTLWRLVARLEQL